MFDLDTEDVLFKVHNFIVSRGDSDIHVRVCEFLSGEKIGSFLAEPHILFTTNKENFSFESDSIEGALSGCLSKIKGKLYDQIFESP